MATVENEPNKPSIWAKIGGVAKTGAKVAGKVLLLLPKAAFYPLKKPLTKTAEVKHDAKVSLKEAVGIKIPEEEKEFNLPIDMTLSSKSLDVQITGYKKGKVTFLAPRSLVGDIAYFTQKQLDEIEGFNKNSKYSNISIDREQNKVSIEIDVEGIIKKLKRDIDAQGLEVSEAQIKKLALQEIAKEIHLSIGAVMKAGGRSVTEDQKIVNGIAGKLYQTHDEHKKDLKKASEIVTPLEKQVQTESPSDTLRSRSGQSSEDVQSIGMPSKEEILRVAGPLVGSDEKKVSQEDGQWQENYRAESQGSEKKKGFSIN